jgi:transcriptional regulator with XRE-family HTH domain
VNPARLVREARKRHGLSQRSLAIRAGTDQAAISRIERGEISPTFETVERLLSAMGEHLRLGAQPTAGQHDPLHVRAMRERAPEERLELAISWNRLAGDLAEAGRRARDA